MMQIHKNINSEFSPNNISLKGHIYPSSEVQLSSEDERTFANSLSRLTHSLSNLEGDISDFHIELSYPLKSFSDNVKKALSRLPEEDRNEFLSNWNLSISENDNLRGYPKAIENAEQRDRLLKKYPGALIEFMNEETDKFVNHNTASLKGIPEAEKAMKEILKVFPELLMTVGKRQHGRHDYTVDMHSLQVLQYVIKDPDFKKLSEKEQKLLETAILFHDLTKEEGTIDKTHPLCSAVDTYQILSKTKMPEDDKVFICELIKNHHWLERYGKALTNREELEEEQYKSALDAEIRKLAFEMRKGNMFLMEVIMTRADLKSVKKNNVFYDMFKEQLKSGEVRIPEEIRAMSRNGIS